jgi:hypothetical protein
MGRFIPGQSGNPGGRPKVVGEVRESARQHTIEAINTLVSIMQDQKAPPAARVLAANSILDRGYGKPAQTIDAHMNRGSIQEMSDAELTAIAAGGLDDDDPSRTH